MSNEGIEIRRATVDDLGSLRELWSIGAVNPVGLDRRVTEFQLAVGVGGVLLGCMGLRVQSKQGCVHSEAYRVGSEGDMLRALLWERVMRVAQNHGLVRLWGIGKAPFWEAVGGFRSATAEQLAKLPAEFGSRDVGWRVLLLREETEALVSLEKELEIFQESQRLEAEALMARARIARWVAGAIALILVLATVVFAAVIFKKQRGERGRAPVGQQGR